MTSISNTTEKKDESVLYHKYKEQIKIVQDKTGINGKYLIIFLFLCAIVVFLGIFDAFFTNLVGTLLPAFLSLKSIEILETDLEKQWITYWIMFSLLHFLDKLSVLFIFYFPFYYFIKYLFLVWLFLPNFYGASYLYDTIIGNNFKRIETLIDKHHQINKKRISDPTTESIPNEPVRQVERIIQHQQSTPVKNNSESFIACDKKTQLPSKSAAEILIEKKNN